MMAKDSLELIRLQVAMAFGQGAGAMLASHDALKFLLTEHGAVLERASRDWKAARFAFVDLMRVLGQIAATIAAMDGHWQIEKQHIKQAVPTALGPCPCEDSVRKSR